MPAQNRSTKGHKQNPVCLSRILADILRGVWLLNFDMFLDNSHGLRIESHANCWIHSGKLVAQCESGEYFSINKNKHVTYQPSFSQARAWFINADCREMLTISVGLSVLPDVLVPHDFTAGP